MLVGQLFAGKLFQGGLFRGSLFGAGGGFDILSLFAKGEQGAWYDPSDLTTLFQDAAGTTPVTADSQPVRLMRDKSGRNNHATAPSDAARPLYRTAGGLHWLEFDGIDDQLTVVGTAFTATMNSFMGLSVVSSNPQFMLFGTASNSVYTGISISGGTNTFIAQNGASPTIRYIPAVIRKNATPATVTNQGDFFTLLATDTPLVLTANDWSMEIAEWATLLRIGNYNTAGFEFEGSMFQLILRDGPSSAEDIDNVESYIAAKSGVTLP